MDVREDDKITGVMIYYTLICERKLWYFVHEIRMEQSNENVQIGKLLDEYSYQREDKHINIDDTINIDFIRAKGILHEVKKSKKIEEASIWQVKYYLYYLKHRGVTGIKGRIDYPLLKQSVEIELSRTDEEKMEDIISRAKTVIELETPPQLEKKSICRSCAYYDICFI